MPQQTAHEDVQSIVRDLAVRARAASRSMARLSPEEKNAALLAMADRLLDRMNAIREENGKDLDTGRGKGLSGPMLDRLELTPKRFEGMAQGLREIAAQRDPVGEITDLVRRPGGFEVGRMRVPIGVIGIIYESRPNVTADAAALCFKAGNATVLRGGSEAIHSNLAIAAALRGVLEEMNLPADAIQLVSTTDRAAVGILLKQNRHIDLIIPRGGRSLIERVVEESTIPVIKHYDGVCHVYVDRDADLEMAVRIAMNAKVQRMAVCNAMETLLVHRDRAGDFLPRILNLYREAGVKIRGCGRVRSLAPDAEASTEESYRTEYLGPELDIRVVDGFEEAVDHIAAYGSAHTDAIVTGNYATARRFLREVDSASVMVNASTRLSDGAVYGLGAEIGISTDKLHARGPMGANELTTTKFIVLGDGAIRE